MKNRVLFVCTGNVCRSPMAEGLFQSMVEEAGDDDIIVESAGIGAMDGMGPSAHSVTVMAEEGIDISRQRSQMLTPELLDQCTHVFGMSRSHIEAIRAYFPESQEKTFVLREFIVADHLDIDVHDPIGMDVDEYQLTRNLIKEALPSVYRFVKTGDPDGATS